MQFRTGFVMLVLVVSACATTEVDTTVKTDWTSKSATQQARAIVEGKLTSEALVAAYLSRIQRLDGNTNSILALNPNAINDARARDAEITRGEIKGPLHGVPVLLKDNIESRELPTTAGSLALIDNNTHRDAPLVTRLREAGAVILGKTNLSEWANFRSESSISGWSAIGGLTRNPYLLARTACGSSSGSGVATALNLASLAVGTETNGSIICPASMNGVVGFKPTVGLISRRHIVPISFTQDTAGPMARTVEDAALMAQVMASVDELDDVTISDNRPVTVVPDEDGAVLNGMKIGVARFRQGDNPHILTVFNRAIDKLQAAGAQIVEIDDFDQPESFWPDSYQVLLSEFKYAINAYLADSPAPLKTRSLADLITFNQSQPREIALFDQSIFQQSLDAPDIQTEEYKQALSRARTAAGKNGLNKLMREHGVDIIVSPSNSPAFLIDAVYGDHAPTGFIGVGYLAAIAGYPHLSVPMGMVSDLPVGLSFISGKWNDQQVLAVGMAFEALRPPIPSPQRYESKMAVQELKSAFAPYKAQ